VLASSRALELDPPPVDNGSYVLRFQRPILKCSGHEFQYLNTTSIEDTGVVGTDLLQGSKQYWTSSASYPTYSLELMDGHINFEDSSTTRDFLSVTQCPVAQNESYPAIWFGFAKITTIIRWGFMRQFVMVATQYSLNVSFSNGVQKSLTRSGSAHNWS
jgi:hypothetical protein